MSITSINFKGSLLQASVTSNVLTVVSPPVEGQIQFPATQNASSDANCLDDYEEGTWTPILQFGGASVGMTYTNQNGYYSKIGNLLNVGGYIYLSAKGSSTGSATLVGVPFATKNVTGNYRNLGMVMSGAAASVTNPVNVIPPNSTTFSLYNFSAGAVTSLTQGHFNDTTSFFITGNLMTA